MAASPILVDSSWYIRHMREGRPLRELVPIAMARDVATCGIVRCEVGRGVTDPVLLKKFDERRGVMMYVPTDNKHWADAEALLWKLNRQGITLPLADVVIACCARRIGAVVLTHDGHFSMIPGIRCTSRNP